ncbi:MAG: outer membrane lipoprotein carrier protein LolA [Chitinophagaceae bacterium]|nr:outer membrane lipoprotein carrier protein LolA [Chitinophagaceae bacterium]
MKKFFVFIIFSLSIASSVKAQQKDQKAEQILNGVSSKYKGYKSVQADFIIKVEGGNSKTTDQQAGTLYLKGNKYKLKINNQEIISDSKTVWTYLKDANEVQINSFETDDNTISPTDIFTIYEKDFLYAFTEEQLIGGKTIQIIDLTPNDKNKSYFKVRLEIDKVEKAIQSAVVFDKNGNRYTYEIRKFIPNPEIADTFFSFDTNKYPGIEVVDLR